MERIPKGIYTPEFRAEAVKLAEEGRLWVVGAAAKRLSVPKGSLANRVRAKRAGRLAKVGQARLCYLSPATFSQKSYAKQMVA